MNKTNLTRYITIFFCVIIGSAFVNATDHLVFSEIHPDPAGSDSGLEFIELYNPTSSAVDISGYKINFRTSSSQYSKTIPSGIIQSYGYYLITNSYIASWKTYWPVPDLRLPYSLTEVGMGLQLEDTSTNILDQVGWGTTDPFVDYYEGSKLPEPISGLSFERLPGSQDSSCGNWIDTDNNVADFIYNSTPNPQNTNNDTEEPCNQGPPCTSDADCTSLNSNYCSDTLVMKAQGKCIGSKCQAITTQLEDCSSYDIPYCQGSVIKQVLIMLSVLSLM
jgi:hypothetical protein